MKFQFPLLLSFLMLLLGCPSPDGRADAGDRERVDGGTGTDAGVDAGTDAGVDAGADAGVDAGTDAGVDAGSGPVSCAEWERMVRALAVEQADTGRGCTEGTGGGCNLIAPTLTCPDGSTLSLCIPVGNDAPAVDLEQACAIPRNETCNASETCADKVCWCAPGGLGTERLVLPSADQAQGCVAGLRLGDTCENEGEICDVEDEIPCHTDACDNVCQNFERGACVNGVVRNYVSEFQSCHTAQQCDLTCDLLPDTVICHESDACASDVCSPDCVVSVCDNGVEEGVLRTDVIPCD